VPRHLYVTGQAYTSGRGHDGDVLTLSTVRAGPPCRGVHGRAVEARYRGTNLRSGRVRVLIVVAALKGGNCKTCLSVILSESGAARWESALIVDADLQASASRWHELAAGAMRAEVLGAPTVDLARRLAGAGADRYPLVVVDCPPAHVEIVRAALALADACLIPCRPAIADVDRLWPTAALAAEASVPVLAVLTMTRGRTMAPMAAREALRAGRVRVAKTTLPQREAFARNFGQLVTGELLDVGSRLLSELVRIVEKGPRR